jgi:hypothetical protein
MKEFSVFFVAPLLWDIPQMKNRDCAQNPKQ